MLATEDLVLYELDRRALVAALAAALGLSAPERGSPPPWLVGKQPLGAGEQLAVYLAIPSPGEDLLASVLPLVAERNPFVLLAPTNCGWTRRVQAMLQGANFVALSEAIEVDGDGRLAATAQWRATVERLTAEWQTTSGSSRPRLATPANTRWSDVHIRLLDGHTASVWVAAVHGVYTFAEMGMGSRKNGSPTVQWQLLRLFADSGGVLTWSSPGAARENQKRREKLAGDLRAFFGIEGDPLRRYGNGWQARFVIEMG